MGLLSAFLRDERGSYTIEFCLWIPVFLLFLAATVDASLLYLTHNNMWNAARDAARRASTGQLGDDPAILEHLEQTLLLGGNRYYVPNSNNMIKKDESPPVVTVQLQTTIADASLFNIFGAIDWWLGYSPGEEVYDCSSSGNIMGCALHAEVTMALEPELASGT